MTPRLRTTLHRLRQDLDRAITRVGVAESEEKILDDAARYWSASDEPVWKSDSHWRSGDAFEQEELWLEIGRRHRALYEQAARFLGVGARPRRVVEWGCGGGANAVHFAPIAEEFVGVDVSAASLEECDRQVRAAGGGRFVPVLADVREPEAAVGQIGAPCDLFLCTYVLELVPSPEYGLRILRIAAGLLADDGLALVQIKYATGSWRTRPRRRKYQREVAGMTTYRIEELWQAAAGCGLRPHLVTLVPRNELDERYAYFVLTRA